MTFQKVYKWYFQSAGPSYQVLIRLNLTRAEGVEMIINPLRAHLLPKMAQSQH